MIEKSRVASIAAVVLAVAVLLMTLVGCSPGGGAGNMTEATRGPRPRPDGAGGAQWGNCSGNVTFVVKRGYISGEGCPTIVGELRNDGNESLKSILVVAGFYCSSGRQVGAAEGTATTASGLAELDFLAPGETSAFKVGVSAREVSVLENFDVDKLEKYDVEARACEVTGEAPPYRAFEVSESSGGLDAAGLYMVTGKVRNTGNRTAAQVKVVGVLYDNQDRIIEVVHTYIEDPLPPGDEAQFQMAAEDKTVSERIGTKYDIQAVEIEKPA